MPASPSARRAARCARARGGPRRAGLPLIRSSAGAARRRWSPARRAALFRRARRAPRAASDAGDVVRGDRAAAAVANGERSGRFPAAAVTRLTRSPSRPRRPSRGVRRAGRRPRGARRHARRRARRQARRRDRPPDLRERPPQVRRRAPRPSRRHREARDRVGRKRARGTPAASTANARPRAPVGPDSAPRTRASAARQNASEARTFTNPGPAASACSIQPCGSSRCRTERRGHVGRRSAAPFRRSRGRSGGARRRRPDAPGLQPARRALGDRQCRRSRPPHRVPRPAGPQTRDASPPERRQRRRSRGASGRAVRRTFAASSHR